MKDFLNFNHAFNIEVEVGQYTVEQTEPSQEGKILKFPIVRGSIRAAKGFTPYIESMSISGTDNATLSSNGKTLLLNVTAQALIHREGELAHNTEIKLQWHGTVKVGKCENLILQGKFIGETPLGNPVACFHLEAEELAGLRDRTFIGQGKFISSEEGLRIFYEVSEVTRKGNLSHDDILERLSKRGRGAI